MFHKHRVARGAMSVTIIIPAFNLWPYTRACLESLAHCARGCAFHVVVVDNGSTDETPEACLPLGNSLFPDAFEYRRLEQNQGFARGCNAGAQGASTPYLLFLNNDITATPFWLEILLQAMQHQKGVHAVSPLLLYPETHRVQHVGVAFDPNLHPVHCFSQFPGNHKALGSIRGLQALSAASLLVRRQAFEAVGGFCTEFINGSEDLDLSCLLRRNGGRLALIQSSVLHHATSVTPGRYDHTAHNAAVLNRRARGCFVPDFHRHAARAGYGLTLTPWLEPYMVRADNSDPDCPTDDIAALTTALQEEPLWEKGYAAMLKLLAHDPAAALPWAELRAALCPSRHAYEQALRLALAVGDTAAATRWKQSLARVIASCNKKDELTDLALSSLEWARQEGLENIVDMYATWLNLHGGGHKA